MGNIIRMNNSTKVKVLLNEAQKEAIQSKLIGDDHPYISIEDDYICFTINNVGKVRDALEAIGATTLLKKMEQL